MSSRPVPVTQPANQINGVAEIASMHHQAELFLFFVVLEIKHRIQCMLNMYSTVELHILPQTYPYFSRNLSQHHHCQILVLTGVAS